MITVAELNAEIDHLNKEVSLLNYEIKNFGIREDTEVRLGELIGRHLYLITIAGMIDRQSGGA